MRLVVMDLWNRVAHFYVKSLAQAPAVEYKRPDLPCLKKKLPQLWIHRRFGFRP